MFTIVLTCGVAVSFLQRTSLAASQSPSSLVRREGTSSNEIAAGTFDPNVEGVADWGLGKLNLQPAAAAPIMPFRAGKAAVVATVKQTDFLDSSNGKDKGKGNITIYHVTSQDIIEGGDVASKGNGMGKGHNISTGFDPNIARMPGFAPGDEDSSEDRQSTSAMPPPSSIQEGMVWRAFNSRKLGAHNDSSLAHDVKRVVNGETAYADWRENANQPRWHYAGSDKQQPYFLDEDHHNVSNSANASGLSVEAAGIQENLLADLTVSGNLTSRTTSQSPTETTIAALANQSQNQTNTTIQTD